MAQRHWVAIGIIGLFIILIYSMFSQAISFNNRMIALQQIKRAEIETTKVQYGQCVVKILETNAVAKSYTKEIDYLADKAGHNLGQFHNALMAFLGAKVIPSLSTSLQQNVQREIISCRNAYTAKVNYDLKPVFVEFNSLQLQFPYSVYNKLFYHWRPDYLNMPKNEAANAAFTTGKIKTLSLN